MCFSRGVVVCRINFRSVVQRTVCTALVVRKRCSKPHRKDMRRNVAVFVSQRVRYAKFYGPGSEKLFDKQHFPFSCAGLLLILTLTPEREYKICANGQTGSPVCVQRLI